MFGKVFRVAAFCAAFPLIATTLFAGDEVEFAKELAKAGYLDLAEETCKVIETDPASTAEDKEAIDYIKGEIKKAQSDKEPDKAKKAELIGEAIGYFEQFIKKYPNNPQTIEAKFSVGELLQSIGRTWTDDLRNPDSKSDKSTAKTNAESAFTRAEKYLEDMISKYFDIVEKLRMEQPDSKKLEDAERDLMSARFMLPQTLYYRSLVYDKDSDDKKGVLEKALNLFDEFEWDYAEYMLMYSVANFRGLTHTEMALYFEAKGDSKSALEQHGKAMGAYARATSLLDAIKETEDKDEMVNALRRSRDIILKGYYNRINACVAAKLLDDAVTTADNMVKAVNEIWSMDPQAPPAEKVKWLQAAIIAKGDALVAKGLTNEAAALFQEAAGLPGPYDKLAKKKIGDMLGGGGSVSIDKVAQAIEGLISQDKLQRAMIEGTKALARITRLEDDKKYAPIILQKMGLAAMAARDFYAGYIAYSTVAKMYSDNADADACAYNAARCMNAAFAIYKDPEDEKAYVEMLELLKSKWSGSKYSKNVPFLTGLRKEEAGDFLGAAADFAMLKDETAEAYEDALSRIGLCYSDHARNLWKRCLEESNPTKKPPLEADTLKYLQEAEKAINKYFEYVKKAEQGASFDEKLKEKRKELGFASKHLLASIYLQDVMKKADPKSPEKAVALMEPMVAEYSQDASKVLRAQQKIVEAYVALSQPDKADEALQACLSRGAGRAEIAGLSKQLGYCYDEQSTKLKALDAKKAQEYFEKATVCFYRWLQVSVKYPDLKSKIKAKDVNAIVDKLRRVADEADKAKDSTKADEYTLQACDIMQWIFEEQFGKLDAAALNDMKPKGAAKAPEKWELGYKLSSLLIKRGEWARAKTILESPDFAKFRNTQLMASTNPEERKKWGQLKAFVIEDYADCQFNLALTKDGGKKADPSDPLWKEASEAYGWLARNATTRPEPDKPSPDYWRYSYKMLLTLFEKRDYGSVSQQLKVMIISYPNFDGDENGFAPKFRELQKKADAENVNIGK